MRLAATYDPENILSPGMDLIISFTGLDDQITIKNFFTYCHDDVSQIHCAISRFEFFDGRVWQAHDILSHLNLTGTGGDDVLAGSALDEQLTGGAGHDRLFGDDGDDLLNGGPGNDFLSGGYGNDVYIYNLGDGQDVIQDLSQGGNNYGMNTLLLGAGITPDDLLIRRRVHIDSYYDHYTGQERHYTMITSDLEVFFKNSPEDKITINGGLETFGGSLSEIKFSDGTVWEAAEVEARLRSHEATDGDDVLIGSDEGVSLYGGDGDDCLVGAGLENQLYGGAGNDLLLVNDGASNLLDGGEGDDILEGGYGQNILLGGAGNDTIISHHGDDLLDGGTGDDYLEGGAGDDIYRFGRGDGQDVINNSGGGDDLLKLEDINPAELWFNRDGDHLNIKLIGSSDQVTVSGWFSGSDCAINTIEAGDCQLLEAQVAQMIQAMASLGAPAGAGDQWTAEQREDLHQIIASHWQRK